MLQTQIWATVGPVCRRGQLPFSASQVLGSWVAWVGAQLNAHTASAQDMFHSFFLQLQLARELVSLLCDVGLAEGST